MIKRQSRFTWRASLALAGLLTVTSSVFSQPQIPTNPLPVPDIDIPVPGLPGSTVGQITLNAEQLWAIVELRQHSPKGITCLNVPGGFLSTSRSSYESEIGNPGDGWLGVGYSNWEQDTRKRCAEAQSTVFHGAIRFDLQPLQQILSQAIESGDGVRLAMRILSATLRTDRIPSPYEPHSRCVIGRGAPLEQVQILAGRPGGLLDTSRNVIGRSDLRLTRYQHNNYINLDGKDVGYLEANRRAAQPTTRDEERNSDGSATLFFSGNAGTLFEFNRFVEAGTTRFPEWALLLSAKNATFRSNKDCLAVYGRFRMNVTYEYVNLG